MYYAQSWLDEMSSLTVGPDGYSDALAMLYAQPWLDAMPENICNSRLDMMYACKYGYRPTKMPSD